MWDSQKFRKSVGEMAKSYRAQGDKNMNSCEKLYNYLADEVLHYSYDTVKSWTRSNSNGPKDKDVVEQLENFFSTSFEKEEINIISEEKEFIMKETYSNFVKEKLYEAYILMKDFVSFENFEDEDYYCNMRSELRKLQCCIPEPIYEKIDKFADDTLEPIIFDRDVVFEEANNSEYAYVEGNTIRIVNDDENNLRMYMRLIFKKLYDIENEIDEFAMKEFYPILCD